MIIKFNSVYYLGRMKRPFSYYNSLLKLQIKNEVTDIEQKALFMDYFGGEMKKVASLKCGKCKMFHLPQ